MSCFVTHTHSQLHTHTYTQSRESFMAEGLFTLSIRSRCEHSGRGDKNRAREVKETEKNKTDTGSERKQRQNRETMISVRKVEEKCLSTETQMVQQRGVKCVNSVYFMRPNITFCPLLFEPSNRNTSPSDVTTFPRNLHTALPNTEGCYGRRRIHIVANLRNPSRFN